MADTVPVFDRLMGALHGLPDVVSSKPSTIRTMLPVIGASQVYIVQTYRQREAGDTVFVESVSSEGTYRIALPPAVADAIARQREALTTKARSKAGKTAAADRKARGELPGFMRKKTDPAA
jgi:hypothetical protein